MSTQFPDGSPAITHAAEPIKPSATLSTITFSGGDEIELKPTDRVMIVGANNSGKSRAIRDLIHLINGNSEQQYLAVVRNATLSKTGTSEDLLRYFQERGHTRPNGQTVLGDWTFHTSVAGSWSSPMLSNGLSGGFIRNLDAKGRLGISDLQANTGYNEVPSQPHQLLYHNEELMERASALFKAAFGRELMINYRGGPTIPIHVGVKPPRTIENDRVSDSYVDAVSSQPALHEQGDGMRSFAGIMVHVISSDRDMTFIDEPEAFLHPPQMRRLGEMLSSNVKGQLFAATHSSDILRGFLEGAKEGVRILRISRVGNVNMVYEASPEAIEELWSTPLLKYSSALDGIFHEQVIICEDDSDCRLYNAMADYLRTSTDQNWHDTAYIPSGGKGSIAKIARTLRAVGVPVKAVYDFDLLSNSTELRTAVEAFGGEWACVRTLWSRIDASVRNAPTPTPSDIKENIRQILDSSGQDELPKRDITDALKSSSEWAKPKRDGLAGLPRGDTSGDAIELLTLLEAVGIYLVPTGEVEGFCPTIGGHGPRFVARVLTDMPLNSPRLQSLREFTIKIHQGAAASIKSAGTISSRRDEEEKPISSSERPSGGSQQA